MSLISESEVSCCNEIPISIFTSVCLLTDNVLSMWIQYFVL